MSRLLEVKNISAGYGDVKALFDVSLHVDEGEIVSLVGANGAGKTTLLRVIAGSVPVFQGQVIYLQQNLLKKEPYHRAELGIAHIPQGRGILGKLTVRENLILGAYNKRARKYVEDGIAAAFKRYPILEERQNQMANSLSGGEQQMLAISRALMMRPKLIIMDEPSLGLAPIVVKNMFQNIQKLAKEGQSILIVEQNLVQALSIATRGYVLETGKIVREGSGPEMLNDNSVREAYLGL